MCGIFGAVRPAPKHVDADLLNSILKRMAHRGPDDHGWMAWDGRTARCGRDIDRDCTAAAFLLHRRLSIIDLSEAGWQPMSSADGRFWAVFNGEIYNYLELRKELQALGHAFRSHTDTEVMLSSYREWGTAALLRFTGMFAIAILDTQERELLLVRDYFGIKPLYYAICDGGLAFSSEMKCLLELPGMAWSVESRVPYLTHDLAEFVLSLPEKYIIANDGTSKWVQRESMRGIVPNEILDRRDKIGFATPEGQWLTGSRAWADAILNDAVVAEIPVFRARMVREELALVMDGKRPYNRAVWRWLNLARWAQLMHVEFE